MKALSSTIEPKLLTRASTIRSGTGRDDGLSPRAGIHLLLLVVWLRSGSLLVSGLTLEPADARCCLANDASAARWWRCCGTRRSGGVTDRAC